MTRLLACVADEDAAGAALAAGFDGVIMETAAGGPPALVERAGGQQAPAMVGWFEGEARDTLVLACGGTRHTLAVRTAPWPDDLAPNVAAGVLLRSDERLLDVVPFPRLAATISAGRAGGRLVALAGGLEPPDIPRVLALDPSMLLVGRALRDGGRRNGALAPDRLAAMRALVPREADAGRPPRRIAAPRRDRIFVNDLVLALDIGAYASERGHAQRVRFSVEAELGSAPDRPARSMGDVVSYDLIADAIHRVATGRRVDFVETLAEEIAAALLGEPRIAQVRVRVEKLDLGAGAVGIEIVRAAYDAA